MDNIIAKKPVAKLENADREIKMYVALLENELKHWLDMKTVNVCLENTLKKMSEEMIALKLQNKGICQSDKQEEQLKNKLMVDNTMLVMENKKLNQQIIMLQNGVAQRKNADVTIKNNQATTNTNVKQIRQTSCINNDDPNANSVLVKGFSEQQLHKILKVTIMNLGRLMNVRILNTDLINVTRLERKFYERHNLRPNSVILIVQFRTPELKVDFLKNKEKLKSHASMEEVEISDYVSDEVYNLYQYAKILKSCGYAHVYWRNNCIYAKKVRSNLCDPVLIKTKEDVDFLKATK